ncbi:hypothetical protein H112_05579 [Trichophyton rubrum D6]|uniref:Transmembrane protein n=3 Tax=Trichophyton rubrum TaxID=5551 RepID=F2SJV4_TRIRC|nr:uncharacterized protein TERG_03309 [Trichophyton rubrum CBS 118892]EZF16573.1 hypothetical protein H100_05597 [Trichophyton rubrum MR850]EZF40252.1 hypothetical protein H102_05564 [Trichophyton rubrum CBS 100081]EZF51077.1 hypothetical protein H103_05587 [Trichophyton rubrum CBS 288.86]EZF61477.1 hypothetical protein H104_05578 [Trichophyton rubrum CBS 289.86]EZF82898.1 hypothetical protein H110_05587 [Trichophyton rubrum MR1448]EZF93437.1 hypothetical protein H113_05634 [Trichophyton rubr
MSLFCERFKVIKHPLPIILLPSYIIPDIILFVKYPAPFPAPQSLTGHLPSLYPTMSALSNRGEITIGNPEAAQDLYGLGVRVGFYLQGLGMILYNYGSDEVEDSNTTATGDGEEPKNEYGKGLTIAATSIALAILASWFVFAARAKFSAAESVITLLMVFSVSLMAKSTLDNARAIVGELTGVVAILLTELGLCAALLWTFAVLVKRLPLLGTKNLVFFFAPVRLDGWFRYLALVYFVIDAATSLSFAWKVLRIMVIVCECWINGRTEERTKRDVLKIENTLGWKKNEMAPYIHAMRWITWILMVLAVELTLHWNQLSPTTDLLVPGQLIPFVAGVIILIDSGIIAGRALVPRCHKAIRSSKTWILRTLQNLRGLSSRGIGSFKRHIADLANKIKGAGQTQV